MQCECQTAGCQPFKTAHYAGCTGRNHGDLAALHSQLFQAAYGESASSARRRVSGGAAMAVSGAIACIHTLQLALDMRESTLQKELAGSRRTRLCVCLLTTCMRRSVHCLIPAPGIASWVRVRPSPRHR